jgi:two-component system CheB/CheR fusion protein
VLQPSLSASADDLVVVGIGASAGGVEALCEFFGHVPAEIDAAFVVVTHLGPHRESKLCEILARCTTLPVVAALDDAAIERGHVYVLSAESILTIDGQRLSLREVDAEHRERNPIDICFASLARSFGENAVGVVLSGVGIDGTVGTKAIKEGGGFTIAQSNFQSTQQHDGMAASAMRGGFIDVSIPVHEMGSRLASYLRQSDTLSSIADESSRQVSDEARTQALRNICDVLRTRVGHDFADYKEKTFVRRIQRRMQMLQIARIEEYSAFLDDNAEEPGHLFRDLLISVTSFFRDDESFTAIEQLVIPQLFESVVPPETIRVWVPGCATGEEAYSLAIMFSEQLQGRANAPRIQIFATDIDESALAAARSGRYPAALLEGMRPDRLQRFFRAEPASYVVTKAVRDLCIFSSHSVIRDPPFSRMDFVSCRNLLIYFNADLQDSVLPIIHYALKPNGYLFLGPSENISRHSQLFTTVEKKHRIFQRRTAVTPSPVPAWISRGKGTSTRGVPEVSMHRNQRVRQMIEERVLEGFSPAHIVVDAEGDILFYSTRTGKYLEPQMGSPSRQLLAMARRGLRLELRATLREAVERRQPTVRERIEVEVDDRVQPIRLTVEPLNENGSNDPLFLVVFTDLGPAVRREDAAQLRTYTPTHDVSHLEDELKETRDRLQSTIEEYETALEELKSGNEELVSVNEELQSTNEELETSKEELQSVNEELHTVNLELAARVDDLHRANADMRNLFESTQIATVFLDKHMIIRSYTPAVTGIFNLIASDRGRPITDIAHNLEDVDLRRDIRTVIDECRPLERPVQQRNSRIFHLMRILPYRTADDTIDGALLTFVDVTAMIVAEEQQRLLVRELNHRVRNMLQVVVGLANQTLHRSADLKQFEKSFLGRMQALARAYELLSRDGWHNASMSELLESQLAPFATEGRRYSSAGEENVMLTPQAALSLGLVLYELATNATKYGSFSKPEGHVQVTWKLEKSGGTSDYFLFRWTETGGPPVIQPTRHGFGTELIKRQLAYELRGEATMDFAPSGLRAELRIPADELMARPAPIPAHE